MKLITEKIKDNIEYLVEKNESGGESYYIEGIFLQAEKKNANGRIYPISVMDNAVNRFVDEAVNKHSAIGELNHPDSPKINYERVSHKIIALRKDGSNYIGKALILDTPMGNLVKGLIKGNVSIGVSSRGLGSVEENEEGVEIVGDDFWLSTIDIVSDPSAPDAYVNGIKESCEYLMENGIIKEVPKKLIKESNSRNILNILKSVLVENKNL